MLQLNNIDKTQLSEPVLNFLNEMELKHAKLGYCLTVSAVQNTNRPEFWQLRFHDTRFVGDESVDLVGAVEWTYGSRSEKEFKTTSRKIQNDRFGHWGNEHASRRTKDAKKAVKIAMEALQPFEWHELSAKGRRDAERAHERWAAEDNKAVYPFRISHEDVYEEVKYLSKYLKDLGIQFNTEAFKKAAAGIEAYEEMQRKAQIKPKFDTVMFRDEKVVLIPNGRALEAQELNDVETLPESTRNGIALLKLVGKDSLLPEIGYRAGENTYFVLV
jgi:hypothetical protein